MSEDCLYLNVWTTAAPNERRPVMVWSHGGGLRTGAGSGASYDGEALARRGVVLVTINAGARDLDFADLGEMWRSGYDMPADDFGTEVDRLWEQVRWGPVDPGPTSWR